MNTELLHKELTDKIIKSYYNVYYALGYGFLEKVYQNALAIELAELGLRFDQEKMVKVYYKDRPV
jgi:GxxExxY protein